MCALRGVPCNKSKCEILQNGTYQCLCNNETDECNDDPCKSGKNTCNNQTTNCYPAANKTSRPYNCVCKQGFQRDTMDSCKRTTAVIPHSTQSIPQDKQKATSQSQRKYISCSFLCIVSYYLFPCQ